MAKDSTAVQKLIELANQKPVDIDLGGLFESDPPKQARRPPPPRPTQQMQPAVAPPPLPRTRTASGTQQAIPAIPAAPEPVGVLATPPQATPPQPIERAPESAADELFGAPAPQDLPPLPVAAPLPPPRPSQAFTAQRSAPPPRPSAQMAAGTPAPELVATPEPAPLPRPPVVVAPPVADDLPTSRVELADVGDNGWFQQSEMVEKVDDFFVGTAAVEKSRPSAAVAIAAAFGLGLVVAGGYLVFSHIGGAKAAETGAAASAAKAGTAPAKPAAQVAQQAPAPAAAAPAAAPSPTVTPIEAAPAPAAAAPEAAAPAPAAAAPAPEAAAAVAPAAAAPPAGTMIDVTLRSEPAGVSVMLIDGGGAVALGKTPTHATLSSGSQHQVLFSRDGYTATIATLDPGAQTDVMVALAPSVGGAPTAPAAAQIAAAPAPAPAAAPVAAAPAPAPAPKHVAAAPAPKHAAPAPAPAPSHVKVAHADKAETAPAPHHAAKQVNDDADDDAPPAHAAPKRTATATSAGTGTLMIGAKPPCEIVVDGRATGLTTPQRALNLQPGSHNITLVNKANGIKKSFSVSIQAGGSTKVVKDFTSMIKK